ncbi:MFS transporter [Citrobacter sp. Igbk 17]|uniref:MFS transporter n=1 Tax=Citrobacter sp. Igbk 17 TaxID=2963957 RepID=UPI0023020747|nr:MFS transporter [Citrobacter sp. Igbk 17]MDA8499513.1 MFS transporter [Citrobacter sp. Igbk 17]
MQNDIHDSTIKRVNKRLIPFLMLLYLIAYIDRSNISVAALQMNADLALTAEMYGIAAGIFYIAYILFEVPSNVILTRVGAKLWIARIMVTWGMIAACMSLVQTPTQLYIMRFLLGVAEAGFTPGIIYYLSCWYPRNNRAHAMSMFYIGAALASVIGLPISGSILNMHGFFDIAGWRWLFLLEGIPAVILGVVVWFYLDDSPAQARWLSVQERDWLQRKLSSEAGADIHHHQWHQALTSKKVWLLSAIWLLQAFGTIGITLFLPLIVKGVVTEQSNLIVSLLSAVPFLFACLFMWLNGRHSDRSGERRLHLAIPLMLAGGLLLVAVYTQYLLLAYLLLVVTVGLNWAITPIFWAATTESLTGVAGAAAIALINAVANVAGLVFPPLMGRLKDLTGNYDASLVIVAFALVSGGGLALYVLSISPTRNSRVAGKEESLR